MAVALRVGSETTRRSMFSQHLAANCFLGGLFVLFSVGTVFTGLPVLWNDVLQLNQSLNVFLSDALLLLVLLAAVVLFVFVGRALEGPHAARGLHAGTVFAAIALFFIGLITVGVGNWLVTQDAWIKIAIPVLVAAGLLFGLAWLFLRPGFMEWLSSFDDQGWFHATSFKPSQGLRVRRGTVMALLVLIGCGVYTMLSHNTMGRGDWAVDLPWGESLYLPILLNVRITVPLILLLVCAWFAWRVVNWPVFADFLIATEAEMNKVSWTTRQRLIQDTIVVLVTVFLLTVFLFVVDVLWIKILSAPPIKVLQIDPMQERAKLNEQTQW